MSVSEHVLNRIILEIKYEDGIVYLDRCGSLTIALERVLGKPFKTTVSPTMSHGELGSIIERIAVRYGPDHYQVDQQWPETSVRFEKVAPIGWGEVSKRLEIESKVTRCGLRLWVTWAVGDDNEGQAVLARSGLIAETPSWANLFGSPTARSYTAISDREGIRLRANLNTIETQIEGRVHPDEQKFVNPHAIQLDLDYGLSPGSGAFSRERLQTFLRTSLQDSRRVIGAVSEVLSVKR